MFITYSLLLLSVVVFFSLLRYKYWLQIKLWEHRLKLSSHSSAFQQLYDTVDGFALSKQARNQRDAIDYIYGEIEFLPFVALLSLTKPDETTTFYDLGSGTGKAVLACAMVYPVKKSVGIELFPELLQASELQVQRLAQLGHYETVAKKITFMHGNFLECDFSEATTVFVNSTTLVGVTWKKLCTQIDRAPCLNIVITTSKPLLSSNFALQKTSKVQMSWGVVIAYIHLRKTNSN